MCRRRVATSRVRQLVAGAVDGTGTVVRVLDQLRIVPPEDWHALTVMPRLADALNDEWVAAYHRDLAARAAEREPVGSDG